MAQIFISHSQRDKPLVDFVLEAFAGTKVKPHLEELEKELPSGVTAQKIENDIRASNAVFILLSENVENLRHTRDWVNWECGIANNKEIVVFEPSEAFSKSPSLCRVSTIMRVTREVMSGASMCGHS